MARVVVGFAGSVADAFALSEKFEEKLTQFSGNLPRAAVELARGLAHGQGHAQTGAMLLCADKDNLLLVSGSGEVIEPDDGVLTIGSGGNYALPRRGRLCRTPTCPRGRSPSALEDRRGHLHLYQRPTSSSKPYKGELT